MLGLPKATELSKQLPKNAIYAKFQMNTAEKAKIDADISRITIVNEVSAEKVHIAAGDQVKSFFVLLVALKKKDFDDKTIITISKLIPQNMMADNIKEDRTPEDLLFQVMLDLGVELSSKIEETTIGGKKVFDVADGFLIACFDKDVNDETIKAIAQKQPYYFVMRDSSLANDSVATNFEQIFATYSPDTVRKVL